MNIRYLIDNMYILCLMYFVCFLVPLLKVINKF